MKKPNHLPFNTNFRPIHSLTIAFAAIVFGACGVDSKQDDSLPTEGPAATAQNESNAENEAAPVESDEREEQTNLLGSQEIAWMEGNWKSGNDKLAYVIFGTFPPRLYLRGNILGLEDKSVDCQVKFYSSDFQVLRNTEDPEFPYAISYVLDGVAPHKDEPLAEECRLKLVEAAKKIMSEQIEGQIFVRLGRDGLMEVQSNDKIFSFAKDNK